MFSTALCRPAVPRAQDASVGAVVVLFAMLFATVASAHTTNRGKATFTVQDTGAVDVRVDLELRDVQELAGVDLAPATYWEPTDASTRERVTATLVQKSPRWMRIFADGRACPLTFSSVQKLGQRGASLRWTAACPSTPKRLRIDWGLAKMTGFDLVAVTMVTAPGNIRHVGVLSAKVTAMEVDVAAPSLLKSLANFFLEGIVHIVFGWDHLLFLLALLLACARFSRLLVVVSGFTLAHSVTLGLGAANLVRVQSVVVESVIALSIAAAAAFAWWRLRRGTLAYPGIALDDRPLPSVRDELLLAVTFGLVHGLGFASMLRAQLSAQDSIVVPLLGFNLGVEAGQLVCVAVAFPLFAAIGRLKKGILVFNSILVLLVAAGLGIGIARALGVEI